MPDVTTLLSKFLQNLAFYSGGVSGVLHVNTTQAGTPASTDETTLASYSLPANTLSSDGKTLRITTCGTSASNGNTKTVRLKFGATTLGDPTFTSSGAQWRLVWEVIRTGASAQLSMGLNMEGGGIENPNIRTPAEATTGAITIAVTGQNGSASANDLVFRYLIVELLN